MTTLHRNNTSYSVKNTMKKSNVWKSFNKKNPSISGSQKLASFVGDKGPFISWLCQKRHKCNVLRKQK